MKWQKLSLILFLLILVNSLLVLSQEPFGAQITPGDSSRATPTDPTSHEARAGNVTELNIYGISITRSWQGYFGNVTGTIQLSDASNNVLYNWSLASPDGQIYASTNSSIEWTNIQCLNYTATGTFDDDTTNAGETSQFGLNLTQLEDMFNIRPSAVDGVDETFNLIGLGTHRSFVTGHKEFTEGQCPNTRLFTNAGAGEAGKFEQLLLYEPVTKSIVFTSLLNNDILGFDNRTHDFQMLVLEDGHGTNIDTTTYYFYVELE